MRKQSTEKRLFRYALPFKKGIIIGIICLMIATAFQLAGPLIAKKRLLMIILLELRGFGMR